MSNETKLYDADQVKLTIGGAIIDSGYDDGEFLSIVYTTEAFTTRVGTDGTVVRSKTNDRRATITVTLDQTSAGNAFLSALHNADLDAPNGAGVSAVLVKDLQGTTLHSADAGWVQKFPDSAFDRTSTARAWVIECSDLRSFIGGN